MRQTEDIDMNDVGIQKIFLQKVKKKPRRELRLGMKQSMVDSHNGAHCAGLSGTTITNINTSFTRQPLLTTSFIKNMAQHLIVLIEELNLNK